jgi:hypothetical protein
MFPMFALTSKLSGGAADRNKQISRFERAGRSGGTFERL